MNSKADDQMGVGFCSFNEKEQLINQAKDGYYAEDKKETFEKLLADGLSFDETPNQQTQPYQILDVISRKSLDISYEKETEKSVVDKYGVSDFSKQGLHQISPQLLPRLAAVQMLYLQATSTFNPSLPNVYLNDLAKGNHLC